MADSLNRLMMLIYQKTQFLSFIWDAAPVLHIPILAEENLKVLAVLGTFVLGIVMRDSGAHLKRRINKSRRRAEERGWERGLTGEQPGTLSVEMEISIESKDNWYTRPVGIISLAVIGGYLVNLLSKLSGL